MRCVQPQASGIYAMMSETSQPRMRQNMSIFEGLFAEKITLTALQAGDLRRADAVLLDERMLCDAFARHGEPQVFAGDHNIQAPLST